MPESPPDALLICYGNGKPRLTLVDPLSGRSKPFASPADRAHLAINAAHRCGDGVIIDAHGDYYGVAADLSGSMFDLGRNEGTDSVVTTSGLWRRAANREWELVSWNGESLGSQLVPAGWSLFGTTRSGLLVTNRRTRSTDADREGDGEALVLDLDGHGTPLPGRGEVCAVADRYVVRVLGRADLRVVDVVTGTVVEIARPASVEHWWTLGMPLDPGEQRVAVAGFTSRTADDETRFRMPTVVCVVDLESGHVRVGERIDGPQDPVWSASGSHLFVGDVYNDKLHIVDPVTMEYAESPAGRVGSSPRVDIGDVGPSLDAAPARMWLFGESISAVPRSREATEADFADRLSNVDDEALRDELRRVARPSIRFVSSDGQRTRTGIGHTRVGGRPDLPDGTRWPTANGAPLAFIGQLDLATAASLLPSRLPQAGTLLFFFGPYLEVEYPAVEESTVIYAAAGLPLSQPPWPADLPPEARFAEVYLGPSVEMTVPNDTDAWPDSQSEVIERAMTTRIAGPVHRMLGHPNLNQGDEVGDLIMQFDSDAEAGFIWGDSGMLYFTVADLDTFDNDFGSIAAHVESG